MAKMSDSYARAVHSSNLKVSKEADKTGQTVVEDTDSLAAMAWADRNLTRGADSQGNPVRPAPLAVPLERLFAGDSNSAHEIVRTMAAMAYQHSFEMRLKVSMPECVDLAKGCLAWHRNGTCKSCGGHGYDLIPGVPSLSSHQCQRCGGTGKIRLMDVFPIKLLGLAQWAVDEMTREAGRAGPMAMKSLSSTLDVK